MGPLPWRKRSPWLLSKAQKTVRSYIATYNQIIKLSVPEDSLERLQRVRVGEFIFSASAYEYGWPIVSIVAWCCHRQCQADDLIITWRPVKERIAKMEMSKGDNFGQIPVGSMRRQRSYIKFKEHWCLIADAIDDTQLQSGWVHQSHVPYIIIVIVNSRFLQRPRKRNRGNHLIHRHLIRTKSIGRGVQEPDSKTGRQSDVYGGWCLELRTWDWEGDMRIRFAKEQSFHFGAKELWKDCKRWGLGESAIIL